MRQRLRLQRGRRGHGRGADGWALGPTGLCSRSGAILLLQLPVVLECGSRGRLRGQDEGAGVVHHAAAVRNGTGSLLALLLRRCDSMSWLAAACQLLLPVRRSMTLSQAPLLSEESSPLRDRRESIRREITRSRRQRLRQRQPQGSCATQSPCVGVRCQKESPVVHVTHQGRWNRQGGRSGGCGGRACV